MLELSDYRTDIYDLIGIFIFTTSGDIPFIQKTRRKFVFNRIYRSSILCASIHRKNNGTTI